jgi:hypothetical protein
MHLIIKATGTGAGMLSHLLAALALESEPVDPRL